MRKTAILVGAFVLAAVMLSPALGKSPTTTQKFVLFSTGDLSEIYYPQLGRPDEKAIQQIEQQIKKQKQNTKYPVMLFDTGDFIGASIIAETNYVPRPVRLFREAGYTAVNVASRDLIAGDNMIKSWQQKDSPPAFVSNIVNRSTASPLAPASATAQLDNLRLRIFGVSTMQHIRALRDLLKIYKTSDVAQHVRSGVSEAKESPELCVVLSDLGAQENDVLAHEVPEVDIILEREGGSAPSARKVNQTLIAASGNAKGLGVLTVEIEPGGLQISSYSHALQSFSPPPRERSLSPILTEPLASRKTLEIPLPTVGAMLPHVEMLQALSIYYDRAELVRRNNPIRALAPGQKDVYFYDLYKESKRVARAFYVPHDLGPGNMIFNAIVALSTENRIAAINFITTPLLAGHPVGFEEQCRQFIGKAAGELTYDKEAVAGAEASFRTLLDDINIVFRLNELLEQNRLP
jgi:hypothetical protein